MELLPKDSSCLATYLQKKTAPLSETEVLKIFVQIVLALNQFHGNNYVHTDLRPSRVFICNNIVKVGPIGLTKFIKEIPNPYLAPEYRRIKEQ